jgi:hypothetical protein
MRHSDLFFIFKYHLDQTRSRLATRLAEAQNRKPGRLRRELVNSYVKLFDQCPLWVISGHLHCNRPCPLYPPKATSDTFFRLSALGQ